MAVPAANQPPKEDPKVDKNPKQEVKQETEEKVSPGLDPNPDPKVVVNAVNPPITPDQVVSMAESPSAAVLPDVKLQNIKISPVKNKTIQGHLAAIEAKMIATEKLMKDVVKLQKRQISTEKELHQRRRELYQNTFEEYLLDKTIDFEDPESGLIKSLKQKSKKDNGGGGLPPVPFNPLRRKQNPNKKNKNNKNNSRNNKTPTNKNPTNTKVNPTNGANSNGAKASSQANRPGTAPRTPVQPKSPILDAKGKPIVKPATVAGTTPGTAPGIPNPLKAPTLGGGGINTKLGNFVKSLKGVKASNAVGLGLSIAAQFGLSQYLNNEDNKEIKKLYELKQTSPEEYQQKLEELRSYNENTGVRFTAPLTNALGMGMNSVPAKLKALGELRPKDVPWLQEGSLLVPDKDDDGTPYSGTGAFAEAKILARKMTGVDHRQVRSAFKNLKSKEEKENALELFNQNWSLLTTDDAKRDFLKQNYPIKPQASGGIDDLNLYHSSSQQYFRDVSSKLEIPKFGGGGLSTAGVRPGFTGMNAQGFNAITGGDKFRPGGFKPQILGRGAYSAPTNQGAMRYAGGQSSLGMPQQPGGVVKTIVPGSAPRFPFLEQQMRVKPATFDKGRVLANKVQSGAYPRSNLAGRMRTGMRMGGAPMRMGGIPKISHPFVMLAEMIINELVSPQSTAVYDQVTGPNAYYNAPGYKGPMPSQNLENAQNTMIDGTSNQQPQIVPLPPDYIKLPSKPKEKTYNTFEVPGIDLEPSMFTRPSRYID